MSDKIYFELRTVIDISVPAKVTIDGITAEPKFYEDRDGDYIEYDGYSDGSKDYHVWAIYIQPDSEQRIFIRASLDGDEVSSTVIDPHDIREPSIDEVIDELSDEIMRTIDELKE